VTPREDSGRSGPAMLERFFRLSAHGTTVQREMLGG
jgi:xanthine/uracil/vitamin C permease (AzgA family)